MKAAVCVAAVLAAAALIALLVWAAHLVSVLN